MSQNGGTRTYHRIETTDKTHSSFEERDEVRTIINGNKGRLLFLVSVFFPIRIHTCLIKNKIVHLVGVPYIGFEGKAGIVSAFRCRACHVPPRPYGSGEGSCTAVDGDQHDARAIQRQQYGAATYGLPPYVRLSRPRTWPLQRVLVRIHAHVARVFPHDRTIVMRYGPEKNEEAARASN